VKAGVVYCGTYDVRKEVNAAVLLLHGDAADEIPIVQRRLPP
jgi:hypothetical protein